MLFPVLNSNNWLSNDFDDFFDTSFMPRINATAPAINVIENDKNYEVQLAAPGMNKDDFTVNVTDDGNLSIKMEHKSDDKKEDKKSHYLRREFSYSKFEQNLVLPDDVDKDHITAKIDNGILRVELPRIAKVEQKNTRKIEVA
ncbi:MAG: Hsp20/alpha crystallin family protein [Prevotella sp.]|jgi:HSP20 family protein